MTNGTPLDPDSRRAYLNCDWAELALRRHGWTGERLQKTSRRVVNDYCRANVPYLDPARKDDMVDFVAEKALQAAMRFKPDHQTTSYGQNGGNHFDSYLPDIMANRCTDWFRSKAEGNGDRRYDNDNKITLSDDPDPADHDTDFEELVDERRRARWQQAAIAVGMSLEEFVVVTMDKGSKQVLTTTKAAA